jgi:hypothetical protein
MGRKFISAGKKLKSYFRFGCPGERRRRKKATQDLFAGYLRNRASYRLDPPRHRSKWRRTQTSPSEQLALFNCCAPDFLWRGRKFVIGYLAPTWTGSSRKSLSTCAETGKASMAIDDRVWCCVWCAVKGKKAIHCVGYCDHKKKDHSLEAAVWALVL